MRGLLSLELRRDGYVVLEVADGVRLENTVVAPALHGADCDVDLVITDVHLPGQSGLEALAHVRARRAIVPVIVITAYGDAETHAAAMQLGAEAVLDKPFDVDRLRSLVRRLLPPG